MIFSKLSDFCILEAIHPPKPLKKHRKYSCFCNPVDFMKIMIFAKKLKSARKSFFQFFTLILRKSDFPRKMPRRRLQPIKMYGIPLRL